MKIETEINELKTRVALLERLVLTMSSQIDNESPRMQKTKPKTKQLDNDLIDNIRRRVV